MPSIRWMVLTVLLAAAPALAETPPRVVMISVDGLMPDYYLRADALGLRVPHLRRLMREGAYARVTGVLPSVTYPSHTTLITGVTPRVHGIGANTVFDPEERSSGAWRWYASEVQAPTLVSAARERGLTSGSVSWPVSVGAFTDWNLPEFWRSGSSHPADLHLLDSLATPGLLKAVAESRGRPLAYPFTDTERTDVAVHILKRQKPALLLLHIFELDDAEHDHGPMSPEALAAVEQSDAHIGQVLGALEAAGLSDSTLVAIVSDHGFLPTTTLLRPNTLLREAGLLELDAKGRISKWQAVFFSSGGSATLHLAPGAGDDVLAKVRALVAARAAEPGSGVRDILDAEGVRVLGGVAAPLLLNAREGFSFSHTPTGEWQAPSTAQKGVHGHIPDRPELHASLVLRGPGWARRGDLGVVRMTRIAPTLARWLGLSLGPRADTPLP